jgi:hypothetical protein
MLLTIWCAVVRLHALVALQSAARLLSNSPIHFRDDSGRVQVRLRPRHRQRDKDASRVGAGESQVADRDLEHVLRSALGAKVSQLSIGRRRRRRRVTTSGCDQGCHLTTAKYHIFRQ